MQVFKSLRDRFRYRVGVSSGDRLKFFLVAANVVVIAPQDQANQQYTDHGNGHTLSPGAGSRARIGRAWLGVGGDEHFLTC